MSNLKERIALAKKPLFLPETVTYEIRWESDGEEHSDTDDYTSTSDMSSLGWACDRGYGLADKGYFTVHDDRGRKVGSSFTKIQ